MRKILVSNSSREGKKLAKMLGYSFCRATTREKYPDTERVVGIEGKITKPADVIYWQFNNIDPFDGQIFNLLAFVAKFSDPRITDLVLPYTPYGRCTALAGNEVDKLYFLLGQLSEMTKKVHLVVIHHDFHQANKSRAEFENILTINVDDQLVAFLKKKFKSPVVLVSPDVGFSKTVKRLADRMGVDWFPLSKKRISPTAVTIIGTLRAKKTIEKNKRAKFVLIDDIVSTGETMSQASKFLRVSGVGQRNISYVAVHDTRRKEMYPRMKVFCSNSLFTNHSSFDIIRSVHKELAGK